MFPCLLPTTGGWGKFERYEMCMGFASRVTDLSSETLLLDGGVEDYEYLNKSRREVDGIDDTEEWNLLKVAISMFHSCKHSCIKPRTPWT